MPVIHFINGPCDGETRTVTQSTLDRGSVVCQGTVYVNSKASAGLTGGQITFVPATDAFVTAGQRSSQAHATQGWSRWMHILAHTGPQQHRRLVAATARMRRIAR